MHSRSFYLLSFLVCATYITSFTLAECNNNVSSLVVPIHYDLLFTFDTDTFLTDQFQGEVNITLKILQETGSITIDQKNLTNKFIEVRNESTTFNLTGKEEKNADNLKINFPEKFLLGLYVLTMRYNGTFSTDMLGMYKSTYTNEIGEIRYFAATALAPAYAKTAFPCFDQPSLKSTYNLSFVVPKGYSVMANSLQNYVVQQLSNNLELLSFRTTPTMSASMVAFVVSNFTCTEMSDGILYRVCSKPQSEKSRQYALDTAPKLLKYFENFTKVPYNISGLGKIDMVATPEKGSSSWGVPTFEESTLLWDDNSTNIKQKVAISIASKLSYMWFGNLVTEKTLACPYLHEALSRYFGYFATAEVENEWELDRQFVVEEVQKALLDDSYGTSPPLFSEEIDELIYSKGASIIRMMVGVVGLDKFQTSLQKYLEQFKFGNSSCNDFWLILQESADMSPKVLDVVQSWVNQTGYPVLNVKLNETDVIITQEPFNLFERQNSTSWFIPITYTTHNSTYNSLIWLNNSSSEVILKNIVVNKTDWIVVNSLQTGHYRVSYDENLLKRIYSILEKNHTAIDTIIRAQIVDNLFNIARSGNASYSMVLHIISFLRNDTDYYPWYSALKSFSDIMPRIKNDDVRRKLMNYTADLMTNVYQSVSQESENSTNQIYILKQILVMTWACRLNDTACVQNAKQNFTEFKNGNRIPKNLQFVTFCTALRNSDYLEQDSDFLWNKFKESGTASDRATLLMGLACAPKMTILNKFLQIAIEPCSPIHREESLILFDSIMTNNPDGVSITLQFLIDNYEKINNYYRDETIIKSLIDKLGKVMTEESQIGKMSDLSQSLKLTQSIKSRAEIAVSLARNNFKNSRFLEDDLENFFSKPSSQTFWASAAVENITPKYLICLVVFFGRFWL